MNIVWFELLFIKESPHEGLTIAPPTYLQYLNAKRPKNDGRNQVILSRHILPHFGQKRLSDIRLEDALAYLEKRRADLTGPKEKRRPVAAGPSKENVRS